MPRYRTAYPPEFRRQMVDLVRSGRTPEELAREFEADRTVDFHLGRSKAERDAGKRIDGPTSAEETREELARLRRENHRPASGARHPGKGGSLDSRGESKAEARTGLPGS